MGHQPRLCGSRPRSLAHAHPLHRRQRHDQCASRAGSRSNAAHDLTLLNRGTSSTPSAHRGRGIHRRRCEDVDSLRAAIGNREFDVVVNFRSFLPIAGASGRRAVRGPHRAVRLHLFCVRVRRSPSPRCRSPSRRRCAIRTGSTRATRSRARMCWSRRIRDRGLPGDDRAAVAHLRRAGRAAATAAGP